MISDRRLELTWKCNFAAMESPNYVDLSENGLKLTTFFLYLVPRFHSQAQFFTREVWPTLKVAIWLKLAKIDDYYYIPRIDWEMQFRVLFKPSQE